MRKVAMVVIALMLPGIAKAKGWTRHSPDNDNDKGKSESWGPGGITCSSLGQGDYQFLADMRTRDTEAIQVKLDELIRAPRVLITLSLT
jgi:hypothetical protein